jgi:hypothetical protein
MRWSGVTIVHAAGRLLQGLGQHQDGALVVEFEELAAAHPAHQEQAPPLR